MIQLAKFHSLTTTELVISCLAIGSVINCNVFGDDGGIEFGEAEPDVNVVVGSTGFTTAEFSVNNLVNGTITVPPGSQLYRKLYEQMTNWKAACLAAAQLIPINVVMYDRANGDRVAEPAAIWVQRPMMSKMKSKTDQAFILAMPNFKEVAKGGTLNVIGA